MRPKTVVAFWASVTAAVFLLGGAVASAEATVRNPSVATDILLALSVVGLVLTFAVAGRIILVVGRSQRSARRSDA